MKYKLNNVVVTSMLLWHALLSNGQTEPVKMTIVGVNHFNSEDSNTEYQCHLSVPDSTAAVKSFRTVWTRNGNKRNISPPDAVEIVNGYPHRKVTLDNNNKNDAFGVFGCGINLDGRLSKNVSVIFMRSDADIVPSDELFSKTVNFGETGVSVTMKSPTRRKVNLFRWLKDNDRNDNNNNQDTWSISGKVTIDDAGVYECHVHNQRNNARQGLMLLIVRACPANRWGPEDCDGVCDICYNGGICDENNGKCICAPGFNGTNCETACRQNSFGDTCEKQCYSNVDDNNEGCDGYIFCLAHPFGCRCYTGWKGLACDTACTVGTYGANCLQTCHCQSGGCDRYTGVCTGTQPGCSSGWTGSNCQQECSGVRFGLDCAEICHCPEDNCNKNTGCTGGCYPEWVELLLPGYCQIGLIDSDYTKMNPQVTVPVTCTANKDPDSNFTDLVLVLSRQNRSLDDSGISHGSTTDNETSRTIEFFVDNVTDGDTLYCQLRKNGSRYAVLEVTINTYVLPSLTTTPEVDNYGCDSVTITWNKWTEEMDDGTPPVIGYVPYYKLATDVEWVGSELVPHESNSVKQMFNFKNLIKETVYNFTLSVVREDYGGEGDIGVVIGQKTKSCDTVAYIGPIVWSTAGAVLLVVLLSVLGIYLWKKYRSNNVSNGLHATSNKFAFDSDNTPITFMTEDATDDPYINIDRPVPILVTNLETYMDKCEKSNTIEQQFESFKEGKQYASEVGEKEINKQKNRFRNMIAYDHSRVVLEKLEGDPDSDYYNANYIKDQILHPLMTSGE